jgi:predicted glycosyltransferase
MDKPVPEIESESLSLMTYSHDGYGLGHFRRTANIAAQVVQEMPDSTVLMLNGCPSGTPFQLPKGVDCIKVPSVIKVGTGAYIPASLRIGRQKAKAIRSSTIQSAVIQFQPHVFLIDHVPAGLYGELLPSLEMLRGLDHPPAIVLGLRDIIDSPEVVTELWRKEATYGILREYYDEIFIYGCQEVFDSALHYGINTEFPGKVSYCGYVCSEAPLKSNEQIREDLRLNREKLVVVVGGGGHDAYPLMHSCLEAFQHMGGELPFEAVFITGPLMEPEQRERLRTQARNLGVRVFASVEDPPSYVNAADLAITMAGYNSLCEVVALKRKALVVPRLGPRAEQLIRARMFQERGLIDMLDPREVSPQKLAQRIIEDLQRTDFPLTNTKFTMMGARNAACRLLALAGDRAGSRLVAVTAPQIAVEPASPHAALAVDGVMSSRISPGIEKSRAS